MWASQVEIYFHPQSPFQVCWACHYALFRKEGRAARIYIYWRVNLFPSNSLCFIKSSSILCFSWLFLMQPKGSVEVPITFEGDNCGLLQWVKRHYIWLCYFWLWRFWVSFIVVTRHGLFTPFFWNFQMGKLLFISLPHMLWSLLYLFSLLYILKVLVLDTPSVQYNQRLDFAYQI